jgi:hypothetical protein
MTAPYDGVFEANIVIQHQVWSQGASNVHGVGKDQWAPAVERRVIAIYPLHRLPHHDVVDSEYVARTMIDFIMEVPDASFYNKNDRVIYNSTNFRVMGFPFNWADNSPFGFDTTFFGGSLHIERVT